MSYRDPESAGRASWYWPTFDTLDEAYAVAAKSFGGWLFAGMIGLGMIAVYLTGKSVTDLHTPEPQVGWTLVGMAIEMLFVLGAAYRMTNGKGWIISWILFALFVFEVFEKLALGNGRGVGWIIFYLAVGASILAGARACWSIHARERAGEYRAII